MHWFWRHHRHHHRDSIWLVVNDFAVKLKPNMENIMAQTLHIDQIDNLTIAGADSAGNPVAVTFDAPPSWTLTDSTNSGATLVAAADNLSAVLTPPATAGATVTVNLAGVIGGAKFGASLDVTFVSGAVASISIVATPAPKPAA